MIVVWLLVGLLCDCFGLCCVYVGLLLFGVIFVFVVLFMYDYLWFLICWFGIGVIGVGFVIM